MYAHLREPNPLLRLQFRPRDIRVVADLSRTREARATRAGRLRDRDDRPGLAVAGDAPGDERRVDSRAVAPAAAFGLLWLTPRLRILNPLRAHWVRPTNTSWLDWIYQALWNLYRQLGRVSHAFTNLLEGESGIMWTLLFLVLFITVFTQRTP